MLAVFQKEIKSYFNNVFGYMFIAIIALFVGIFGTSYHFRNMSADFSYTLDSLALIILLVTPLLTMRIIAEERQRKTDQLLYSLPISVTSTVIAKYLAMLTVFTASMVIVSIMPLTMSAFGDINLPRTFGAMFAFYLMGACLLAIGMFISSLTENQVISAIISFVTMMIIYFATPLASMVPTTSMSSFIAFSVCVLILGGIVYIMVKNYLAALTVCAIGEVVLAVFYKTNITAFQGLFGKVVGWLSVYSRCSNFYNGIFDLTAVVYFISVIALFVFLTVQAVEKRRWS